MVLASKYFQKLVKGPWAEPTTMKENKRIVEASGWQEDAFLIVLNAIHGHFNQVPRDPPLSQKVQVATICDYYQCAESLSIYAAFWESEWLSSEGAPEEADSDEAGQRLMVSIILGQQNDLRRFISWHVSEGCGPIGDVNGPFMPAVLSESPSCCCNPG
jgi:hypothetical protein